ncbi:LANO_0H07426g1_1 [Lachancea nothofagi CBS 11611]|uniref:LANO_0H07426g1_1 n=1 Tax=Lachancea nothofagi CBS 11611 TaxID=1266666 RepID=A0A1G4KLJ2_9SACH|nr:LANO_0H07426g1_1 [Lachancea nothofagi CBS 11611]
MIHVPVVERDLPTLTTSSSGSSSNTSYPTPSITPPSIKGNPFIWSSDKPSGTIFIAVGSIVGFILIAIILAYFISAYISQRQTEKQRYDAVDHEFNSHVNGDGGFYETEKSQFIAKNPPQNSKNSVIRLLDAQEPGRASPILTNQASNSSLAQEFYSSIQDQNAAQNRKSLFISPTVEVINQQRKSMLMQNMNTSSSSLLSESSPELNKPERAASPDRKKGHQSRSKSNLSFNVTSANSKSTSPDSAALRETPVQRPKAPSMYLEKMLEDN